MDLYSVGLMTDEMVSRPVTRSVIMVQILMASMVTVGPETTALSTGNMVLVIEITLQSVVLGPTPTITTGRNICLAMANRLTSSSPRSEL